jgi:hypothetical protein
MFRYRKNTGRSGGYALPAGLIFIHPAGIKHIRRSAFNFAEFFFPVRSDGFSLNLQSENIILKKSEKF